MLEMLRAEVEQGSLRLIDFHFAKFVYEGFGRESSGESREIVALLAAEVSRELGRGSVCLNLLELGQDSLLVKYWPGRLGAFSVARLLEEIRSHPALVAGVEGIREKDGFLIVCNSNIYLPRYCAYEEQIALDLSRRLQAVVEVDESVLQACASQILSGGEDELQKAAVVLSLLRRFAVISGGPGTGKTLTIANIIAAHLFLSMQDGNLLSQPDSIILCAPTGKAALRLEESIERAVRSGRYPEDVASMIPLQAQTLHRVLGISRDGIRVKYNRKRPLAARLVVVDEASMIDIYLLVRLLDALPEEATLILVGDKNQLSSVEAGSILADICEGVSRNSWSDNQLRLLERVINTNFTRRTISSAVVGRELVNDSICILEKSFRYDSSGGLGKFAEAIREGKAKWGDPAFSPDVTFSYQSAQGDSVGESILERAVIEGYREYLELVGRGIVDKRLFVAFNKFRVLCAVRDGPWGLDRVQANAERMLARARLIEPDTLRAGSGSGRAEWYCGRPVLVTENDYSLGLANGDIGISIGLSSSSGQLPVVTNRSDEIDRGERSARVIFPRSNSRSALGLAGVVVGEALSREQGSGDCEVHAASLLKSHELGYALTVHKAQGSEFDRVLLILPDSVTPVLCRELLYTAVTRAKTKLEIVGSAEVFNRALNTSMRRVSGLSNRLSSRVTCPSRYEV